MSNPNTVFVPPIEVDTEPSEPSEAATSAPAPKESIDIPSPKGATYGLEQGGHGADNGPALSALEMVEANRIEVEAGRPEQFTTQLTEAKAQQKIRLEAESAELEAEADPVAPEESVEAATEDNNGDVPEKEPKQSRKAKRKARRAARNQHPEDADTSKIDAKIMKQLEGGIDEQGNPIESTAELLPEETTTPEFSMEVDDNDPAEGIDSKPENTMPPAPSEHSIKYGGENDKSIDTPAVATEEQIEATKAMAKARGEKRKFKKALKVIRATAAAKATAEAVDGKALEASQDPANGVDAEPSAAPEASNDGDSPESIDSQEDSEDLAAVNRLKVALNIASTRLDDYRERRKGQSFEYRQSIRQRTFVAAGLAVAATVIFNGIVSKEGIDTELLSNAMDTINFGLESATEAASAAVEGTEQIGSVLAEAAESATDTATQIREGATEGAQTAIEAVTDTATQAREAVTEGAQAVTDTATQAREGLPSGGGSDTIEQITSGADFTSITGGAELPTNIATAAETVAQTMSNVEAGNGISQEVVEAGKALGIEVSSSEARDIAEEISKNLKGTEPGTYIDQATGQVRLLKDANLAKLVDIKDVTARIQSLG